MKNYKLTEDILRNMVQNEVRRAINESMGNKEYVENFKRNVFEANQCLYRALSFFNDPKEEPLVRQIKRAFELTNDAAYYLERRK